jgi:hypothetical protein
VVDIADKVPADLESIDARGTSQQQGSVSKGKSMIGTPATIAHAYVQLMLRLTNGLHRLHFCVQTKSHRTPPSICYEWQNGCLFGISLPRRDAGKAETWVAEAIAAGYRPLASFRKRGSAYCPNEISVLLQAM